MEQRTSGPVAPDAAFGCALALTDSLGYTLTASDRASGFLTAEHRYTRMLVFPARDILTVAIRQATGGETEVHVTGTSEVANQASGGVPAPGSPTSEVMADASLVGNRCSKS